MKIEKIKFERSGGFAGIRLSAEIELDDLPDEQRREILHLLDKLDFDELPEKQTAKPPVPDEFFYTITVEGEHEAYRISAGETALPDPIRPLVEILESAARRQMRKARQDE
jgi:hypothetical protein